MTTPAATMPRSPLLLRLIPRLVFGQFLRAVILFGPANTLDFWQAWVYLALLSLIPISFVVYFAKHDPGLVERRMLRKEKVTEQKFIITLWKILSVITFAWCGLDYRFGWTRDNIGPVPLWL